MWNRLSLLNNLRLWTTSEITTCWTTQSQSSVQGQSSDDDVQQATKYEHTLNEAWSQTLILQNTSHIRPLLQRVRFVLQIKQISPAFGIQLLVPLLKENRISMADMKSQPTMLHNSSLGGNHKRCCSYQETCECLLMLHAWQEFPKENYLCLKTWLLSFEIWPLAGQCPPELPFS